jgi:hypothetical protein
LTEAVPQIESGERIQALRVVRLHGDIEGSTDLSGVAAVGEYLVLGADEGHRLQILQRDPAADAWHPHSRVALAKQDQEADIEAIAYDAGLLYAIGSHAFRRRRMRPELSARKNRERMLSVQQEPARHRLYRLAFDPATGACGPAEHIDLSKRLRKDPLLGRFFGLPGRENGVDIEGMACREGSLYLGFRGPVLRGNYVPVMVLAFARPKEYRLVFVQLDGQGIRDMVALADGFLILSGPVNDAPGPFCLWWWDGRDQVPGRDRTVTPARLLGAVSSPGGAMVEGLALLDQQPGWADLLLLYDTHTAVQAITMRVLLDAGRTDPGQTD